MTTQKIPVLFLLSFTLFSLLFSTFYCINHLEDMIYTPITAKSHCRRLLNSTHQIGCSSSSEGSSGLIFGMFSMQDYETFNLSRSSEAYCIVTDLPFMKTDILKYFYESGSVSAVIILDNPDLSFSSSTSEQCPNCDSGLYRDNQTLSSHPWNPYGGSLMYVDFHDLPISIVVDPISAEVLRQKSLENRARKDYPLWSCQVSSFMHAARNSHTCLSRHRCDPVGGYNVFGSIRALLSSEKVVLVLTSIDSASLFLDYVHAAEGALSGMLVSAVAAMTFKGFDRTRLEKNVLFVGVNGEAYGLIGSSSFAAKFARHAFGTDPNNYLSLDNIDSIIELSQVGLAPDGNYDLSSLYIHSEYALNPSSQLEDLVGVLLSASDISPDTKGLLVPYNSSFGIPPSSAQSFLLQKRDIPTVVITDYQDAFLNRVYFSILDTVSRNNMTTEPAILRLCKLATVTARAVYKRAAGALYDEQIAKSLIADCALISQALYCFSTNFNCTLIRNLFNAPQDPSPPTFYAGSVPEGNTQVPFFMFYMLSNALATSRNSTTFEECKQKIPINSKSSILYSNNSCINSSTFLSFEISPAFEFSDGKYQIVRSNYSTWTESRWQPVSIRVYLSNSLTMQYLVLSLGIVLVLFGLCFVWMGKKILKKKLKLS